MRRRDLFLFAGLGVIAALARQVLAQQPKLPFIGFLSSRSSGESEAVVAAFHRGLAESGYVVGRNVAIEYRWAEGRYDRLPTFAAELAGMRVAAILAAGGPPSQPRCGA
jgi:putative tryptophan/tyrosine transport system substrate-binding protein